MCLLEAPPVIGCCFRVFHHVLLFIYEHVTKNLELLFFIYLFIVSIERWDGFLWVTVVVAHFWEWKVCSATRQWRTQSRRWQSNFIKRGLRTAELRFLDLKLPALARTRLAAILSSPCDKLRMAFPILFEKSFLDENSRARLPFLHECGRAHSGEEALLAWFC